MTKLKIEHLDWDSQQLGIPCGLIIATELEDLPQPTLLIDQIKELCEKRKDLEFITIKLPSDCIEVVNSLIKMGAILIDAELTFSYFENNISKDFSLTPENLKLLFCKKCDGKAFIPLSKEMRLSRFFLDPNISENKAIHLWETSIKNHCEGFADHLLVAYYNDKPCGIVTLKFKDNKRIFLHIVGVLKEFQGQNIGKLMLKEIVAKYHSKNSIYVETQSINVPAQLLYQSSGFYYNDLKYVLHYWQKKNS